MNWLLRIILLVAALPLLLMLTGLLLGTSLFLAGDFLAFLIHLILRL